MDHLTSAVQKKAKAWYLLDIAPLNDAQ